MRRDANALRVLAVERFDREQLLSALRRTRLQGFGRARPYAHATLELSVATDPERLAPAQRYVLSGGVERVLALRAALLRHRIDLFALDGGAYVRTSDAPEQRIPVIPPIVEESHEPDGRTVPIVNDGIHRVFAARRLGLPINTVTVTGVPRHLPYYALALPGGWSEVSELDELPEGFPEKDYRDAEDPRSLYRELNEVFPGVQPDRRRPRR